VTFQRLTANDSVNASGSRRAGSENRM
jgi:hypothetical protein